MALPATVSSAEADNCIVINMADSSSASFDSKNLGLRAQKKLLSKMASKKIAKVFIDDASGRILDNLHLMARDYSNSKKTAEKLMKNLIKIVIKIGILYRNDEFNMQELKVAEMFKMKFRTVVMTVISFFEVDFTFDKLYLSESLAECQALLKQLVVRHLTDKSLGRIDQVFSFFGNADFLEYIFKRTGSNSQLLKTVVDDLNKLLDEGTL
ncbi:hypothetical protein CAPTEDRAFT_209202 [Capitella teleta]|uniref:Tumor necrosis factor alpha-induced protein 8-like protein n=1 Tax=Capitella teleta TaxID=283909 RepID=R7VLX8_CAPTE|nr:hypothetical protein CAPTEDRAFT_209202 [Capitella teleta]|eukprot:ELU18646.1 hypothetical protein CAPTEDRAFT_209202 [Capitella teleta]